MWGVLGGVDPPRGICGVEPTNTQLKQFPNAFTHSLHNVPLLSSGMILYFTYTHRRGKHMNTAVVITVFTRLLEPQELRRLSDREFEQYSFWSDGFLAGAVETLNKQLERAEATSALTNAQRRGI